MWKNKIYFTIGGTILIVLIFLILYRFLSDKNKLLARCLAYSILLEIAISPLGGYVSLKAATLVGFILFFILTYFLLIKFSPRVSTKSLMLFISIGILLINIPRLFEFRRSLISLPDDCFHLIGFITGYLFFKIRTFSRWIILGVASALCIFVCLKGYDLWGNKIFYGTYSGNIGIEETPQHFSFIDSKDSLVSFNQQKGKVVLLDFWNSRCGVCFRKFPEVQHVYNKYKQNPNVNIFTVNFFFKDGDKDGDAFRIIKERGYTFPVLICKDMGLLKELNITGYPTVLILNQNGKIVYRGDIEEADAKIQELLN